MLPVTSTSPSRKFSTSSKPPSKGPNPLLFLGIAVLSGVSFYYLVHRRAVTNPASARPRQNDHPLVWPTIDMADASNKTIFDSSKITVIFILGGPGAGKGTQCGRLVEDFNFCHLSAGDLLRAEQDRPQSEFGELIRTCIREGTIVPMEVTIKLLENAMRAAVEERNGKGLGWADGRGRFLIDGFPRKMDQALKFEEDVCVSSLTIFFTTTEEVMLKRLLVRGETSGREDDNVESIKKRFRTYKDQTMPVIEHYRTQQKVAEIDSTGSVEEVHAKASVVINRLFAGEPTVNVTI